MSQHKSQLNSEQWFTEIFQPSGSAFSLEITQKLAEVQSPFQHIEMYQTTQFGNMMVIDGVIMLSSRDNFLYHEMLSHPALVHPSGSTTGGDYRWWRLRYLT